MNKIISSIAMLFVSIAIPVTAADVFTLCLSLPKKCVQNASQAEFGITIENEKGDISVGAISLKSSCDSLLTGEYSCETDGEYMASAIWTEDPHVGFVFIMEPGTVTATYTNNGFVTAGTRLNDVLNEYKSETERIHGGTSVRQQTDSITEAYMRRYADTPLFGVLFSSHSSVIYSSFLDTKTEVERLWAIGGEKQKRVKTTLNTYKRICHNDIEEGMHYRDAEIGNATVEGGSSVRLSDFIGKGKWVLIDFWASWCVGCRQAIPRVKKAYEALKNSNIEFVSIAVWDKRPAALKAIKEENMPWRQLIDEKGVCGDTYMFNAIPRLMLFAPDGTLADKDVQSMNILQTLQQKMGEK